MFRQLLQCILVFTVLFHGRRCEQLQIVYDQPDLSTTVYRECGEFQLDAFKVADNDAILQSDDSARFYRLQWFSLGEPKLVHRRDPQNRSKEIIFDLKTDRASVLIDTLTAIHKKELVVAAQEAYGVDVNEKQFSRLPLSKVNCQITTKDTHGRQWSLIAREVINPLTYPLRVDFNAAMGSRERQLVQRLMKSSDETVNMTCTFVTRSRKFKSSLLEILSKKIEELIVKKLLQASDKAYVTRGQFVELSSKIYSELDILTRYGMKLDEFGEALVGGFLLQAVNGSFSDVDIDEALSLLSPYALENAVTSEDLKTALSSVFSVNNRNRIVVNQSVLSLHERMSGSTVAVVVGITVGPSSSASLNSILSLFTLLKDQLNALNSLGDSDVHWKIEDKRLVPDKLRVAELWRSNFNHPVPFNRTLQMDIAESENDRMTSRQLQKQQRQQQYEGLFS